MMQQPESVERRFSRVLARARRTERIRIGLRAGIGTGILLSGTVFALMLARGLGFLAFGAEVPLVAVALAALAALVAALEPVAAPSALRRVDRDHNLRGGLATAWWMVQQGERLSPMAHVHVIQTLRKAESMGLARSALSDLGASARVLGVLCLCVLSIAFL